MKECKSYKQFIQIQRKYGKRYYRMRRGRADWHEWIAYNATTIDELEEIKTHRKHCDETLRFFVDKTIEMFGKDVKNFYRNCIGVVTGLQITEKDYYYILTMDDGGKMLISCCGHIEVDE